MEKIKSYGIRYSDRISNWHKLEQDLYLLANSKRRDKGLFMQQVIAAAADKGLDYLYLSRDKVCIEFRKELYNVKKEEFMNSVLRTLA